MKVTISKKQMLIGITVWWLLFLTFSVNAWNPFGLLYVVGIPFVLLFPGYCTLYLFQMGKIDVWARISLALVLSILEVIIIALLGNWLLPLFGIERPLDTVPFLWEFSTFIAALVFFAFGRMQPLTFTIPRFLVAKDVLSAIFLCIPFIFIALSVFGAERLNEGHGEWVTMLMLFMIAVYSFFISKYAEKFSSHVVPIALYCIALSLLFMTSLRGSFISGHDIQREFFVFQLTKDAGIWNMASYIDAYNACLSITILPTVLSNILSMPDVLVFKVLFQLLFAVSAILIYVIGKTWLDSRLAFLTGLLFISFPTFFQDMPFLLRQEIAFLFYGALLYALFEKLLTQSRSILFFSFGIGIVLSHYSTTYTVLFVLLLTSLLVPVLTFFHTRTRLLPPSSSAFAMVSSEGVRHGRKVTLANTLTLLACALLWTSVITGTDGHVREVLQDMWFAIQSGFEDERFSPDVFALFGISQDGAQRSLNEFVTTKVMPERELYPEAFYASSTYIGYTYAQVSIYKRPLTTAGKRFEETGVSFSDVVLFFGSILAKLLIFTIPLGMVYLVFRRKWVKRIDTEYYILAVSSVLFILLCIIVPLLSKEYGVFRAIQQSIFLLSSFILVGILILGQGVAVLFERWQNFLGVEQRAIHAPHIRSAATGLVVFFFLYATGFMGQLVGGNIPPVHLNNYGDDYRHYVVEDSEQEAILWLKERIEEDLATGITPIVQADRFGKKKLLSTLHTPVSGNIFPGSIRKDAYVFVGPALLEDGIARVEYDGAVIAYTYPVEFLEVQKEVVFENEGVRIYK